VADEFYALYTFHAIAESVSYGIIDLLKVQVPSPALNPKDLLFPSESILNGLFFLSPVFLLRQIRPLPIAGLREYSATHDRARSAHTHGRSDVSVSKQLLHRAQIDAALDPLRGSKMSKVVKSDQSIPVAFLPA
jgi:hypothetical protein